MNEAARQMVMDKYGLSFDKPLESLTTLLPLAKKRAEQIKKNAEQIHYDMAYFDLCAEKGVLRAPYGPAIAAALKA